MKFSRLIAALLVLTLAACSDSKDESTPAYPAIPADITFDKGGLARISDADFAEGLSLFKSVDAVNDVGAHLLTAIEDDKDRAERQREYDEMTAEQRAFVDSQKQNCEVTHEEKQPDFGTDGIPKSGASSTLMNKQTASGPTCAIESTNANNGLLTIISVNGQTEMETGGRFSLALDSSIKSPADQQLMGYAYLRFSGVAEARATLSMFEERNSYEKGSLTGSADILKDGVGQIELRWSREKLAKKAENMTAIITSIELARGGKTFVLSSHIRTQNGLRAEEHFLGDRKLSTEEAKQLRDILVSFDD